MARLNRRSAGHPAITRPILTGDSHADWAFWQLSSILVEIAETTIHGKNDGGVITQKQMRVVPLIKDAANAQALS